MVSEAPDCLVSVLCSEARGPGIVLEASLKAMLYYELYKCFLRHTLTASTHCKANCLHQAQDVFHKGHVHFHANAGSKDVSAAALFSDPSHVQEAKSASVLTPKAEALKAATLRPLDTLRPFVPRSLMTWFQDDPQFSVFDGAAIGDLQEASSRLTPSMQTWQGAVMVADVCGFTALTEGLSKQGSAGVELLISCINEFFAKASVWTVKHAVTLLLYATDTQFHAHQHTSAMDAALFLITCLIRLLVINSSKTHAASNDRCDV